MSINPPISGDGWNEWARYVLQKLQELDTIAKETKRDVERELRDIRDAIGKLTISMAERDQNYTALRESTVGIKTNATCIDDLEKKTAKVMAEMKIIKTIGYVILTILTGVIVKWITGFF